MEIPELKEGQIIRLSWLDNGTPNECISEVVKNRKKEKLIILTDVLYLTHPGQEDASWELLYDGDFNITEIIGQKPSAKDIVSQKYPELFL